MKRRVIPFSPPDISQAEIDAVTETLRSGWITTGPKTKLLERRLAAYIETGKTNIDCNIDDAIKKYSNKVVCLNSATAAEELNFRIIGIREGDEVIIPAYTYTATASAAVHCGATIKIVDIQKNGDVNTHSPEIDYNKLSDLITEKTKAIVLVDIGGVVCDYDKVYEIVEKKKNVFKALEPDGTPLGDLSSQIQKSIGRVIIIADCAHSLGANRVFRGEKKYCGTIADFSSFSFHAVKNFTTAEGGASTWRKIKDVDNKDIYKFYQLLSLHGQNKDALAKARSGAWEYDIIGPWYKCNMTDIMASIGLVQLDRYDGLLKRRKEIIQTYNQLCNSMYISYLIHSTDFMESSNHLFLIRIPEIDIDRRNKIINRMSEYGVATNVHYKPLPMLSAYKNISGGIDKFPNAFSYYSNLISLPLHTLLSDDDVEYVCEVLRSVAGELVGC